MKEVLCERPSVETGVGMLRQENKFTLLDCFCGIGGVSNGFALEGFDVTGIDIVDAPKMLGYKHRFIQADMLSLKGEDFKGYDVIWGSPPCRDFSRIGEMYGHNWKCPPNPMRGLELVNIFLDFVKEANPRYWVLENVYGLSHHLPLKPKFATYITISSKNGQGKHHAFWGNFPDFLLPKVTQKKIGFHKIQPNGDRWMRAQVTGKNAAWINAKIPLPCSQAFAKACREALLEKETCP
jgi:DNA (cytosine-5)-methyltransferase 1